MQYSKKEKIVKSLPCNEIRKIIFEKMPTLKKLSKFVHIKRVKGVLYIDARIAWVGLTSNSVQQDYKEIQSFKDHHVALKDAFVELIYENTGEKVMLFAVVEKHRIWFEITSEYKEDILRAY